MLTDVHEPFGAVSWRRRRASRAKNVLLDISNLENSLVQVILGYRVLASCDTSSQSDSQNLAASPISSTVG